MLLKVALFFIEILASLFLITFVPLMALPIRLLGFSDSIEGALAGVLLLYRNIVLENFPNLSDKEVEQQKKDLLKMIKILPFVYKFWIRWHNLDAVTFVDVNFFSEKSIVDLHNLSSSEEADTEVLFPVVSEE